MKHACPCHSGHAYADCCQRLHHGEPAPTAERLMRSRYSAYALRLPDYLLASWHTSTRPSNVSQADFQGMKWLGLTIVEAQVQDDQHATVMFKARFKNGQNKTQILHENSRFVLENSRWFYVDGDILSN
jgi:SEC-C motif-containing protein